jgi:hypothetical protein
MAWALAEGGIVIVVAVTALAMDRSHRRRLEEHNRKMDDLYRRYR